METESGTSGATIKRLGHSSGNLPNVHSGICSNDGNNASTCIHLGSKRCGASGDSHLAGGASGDSHLAGRVVRGARTASGETASGTASGDSHLAVAWGTASGDDSEW